MYNIYEVLKKYNHNLIVLFAILCVLFAVASIILSFKCSNQSDIFTGVSVTFATLAGAILVFSTLNLQRKSLEEEKRKYETSRFDSKFHPLLSSFRMNGKRL